VLDGLAGILGSPDEERVGASGSAEGKLVEGEALAAGSRDACAGGGGEAEGGNAELGHLEDAVVVRDGADDDDRLGGCGGVGGGLGLGVEALVAGQVCDARDGDRWPVGLGHEQTAQDDLVEVGLGAAGKEAVELDEQQEVRVLALGRCAAPVLDVLVLDVDT